MLRTTQIHLLLFLLTQVRVEGLGLNDLLPYGQVGRDSALHRGSEDANSVEAQLSVPFSFYHRQFNSIFINENGLVSFLTEVPSFYNVEFPMDYPIIAPFYADVDIRKTGQIYYRVSTAKKDLGWANKVINKNFRGRGDFSAREVVVVTWDQVAPFDRQMSQLNTIQLVLASDGTVSYSLFLYPEHGIQWVRGQGKNRNSPDARAQIGFMSGEGRSHLLPMSGKDQVSKIAMWSNTERAGLWIFRVGLLDPLEDIIGPPVNQVHDPRSATSCDKGSALCHTHSTCSDHQRGFCCSCSSGWYGNGENCMEEGQPQRVNGRVSGSLNGVSILEQDLHCYIVTADGRTYTAISRISPDIGWDIQGLVPVGSAISWLFASPKDGGLNGFGLTGGLFNYSAEVTFPKTGHRASVVFTFKGLNVFDYLTADVAVSGTVPRISERTKVSVEDHSVDFTRVEPGLIRARSSLEYRLEGSETTLPYTVEHTIRWDECAGSLGRGRLTLRLSSARNFILYDDKEEIVRYAMTSHVSTLGEEEDPCRSADCSPLATCLVDGTVARCVCPGGYWDIGQGNCEDIDECLDEQANNCHAHAQCTNLAGSFGCSCKNGYVGNGITCEEEVSCADLQCSEDAECRLNNLGQGECICRSGYQGDGVTCNLVPSKVKLRGEAVPEYGQLTTVPISSRVKSLDDLGPEVTHTFEVTNLGPFDVGNLLVKVSWPVRSPEGSWLLYLPDTPYVQYSKDTREKCEVDPGLVDPLRLTSTLGRLRKRQTINYDDAEKGENKEVEDDKDKEDDDNDEEEDDKAMPGLGLGTVYEDDSVFASYDYSHLLPAPTDNDDQSFVDRLPATNRVVQQPAASAAAVAERQPVDDVGGHQQGRSTIVCRLGLTVDEAAVITVKSRLYAATLTGRLYAGVAQVALSSAAEIVPHELVTVSGPVRAETTTIMDMAEPVFAAGPGMGVKCGAQQCHKYAICAMIFDTKPAAVCKCPPGFSGDGVASCEPGSAKPSEPTGCGSGQPCGDNASCQVRGGTASCECNPGHYGDGYLCAVDRYEEKFWTQGPEAPVLENVVTPECIFGVCSCDTGYTFDGSNCVLAAKTDDLCKSSAECGPNEACQMDSGMGKRRCMCAEGFRYYNTTKCQAVKGDICKSNRDCAKNEICQFSGKEGRFRCQCADGHQLIGEICLPPSGHTCQAASDCAKEQICHFIRKENRRRCLCAAGFEPFNGGECRAAIGRDDCRVGEDCQTNQDCIFHGSVGGYRCSCEDGFVQDGGECVMARPQNLCKTNEDCGKHALCKYSGKERRYRCECSPGYLMTGATCLQDPKAGCDVLRNCDANAECVEDFVRKTHYCRCGPGYSGDGQHCEKEPDIGCNLVNNCHKFATCLFHSEQRAFRCECDSARGLEGDGLTCRPAAPCWQNPVVCDANADCSPTGREGHGCRCRSGYLGDGLTCIALPRYEGNYLLLAQGMALLRVPFSGQGSRPLAIKSKQLATGIDLDCSRGQMYWSDTTSKAIHRANMDGTKEEVFADQSFSFPEGLAVDWISRNLYVTDPGRQVIEVIGLDTKMRFKIAEEGIFSPRGVAVHPGLGRVYWTDWDRYRPAIEMANMDGTGRQLLVSSGLGEPNSIAVDYYSYEVCWADGGRKELNIKPKIDCIGAEGSGRRTVHLLSEGEYPYGLAITDNNIFWTDWNRKFVHSVDKTTGMRQKSIPYSLAGVGRPYDIVNVPLECPNIANTCQGQPCGEDRMCLPNGVGGHTCR